VLIVEYFRASQHGLFFFSGLQFCNFLSVFIGSCLHALLSCLPPSACP
jgi:hypothetical protein